jgi:hypothetical protein
MIIPLDVWPSRQAALDAIFKACAASPACAKAHPDPAATLREIEKSLADSGPEGREVDIVDPRTGQTRRVRMTFDVVLGALQLPAYAPETAVLLPEMLSLAARGDYGPLFAANPSMSSRESERINPALHFSVTCAEDAPRITPETAQSVLANLPARRLAEQTIAVCNVWPRGTMPADFAKPVKSAVPALLFSCGMDPVTPPANGALVAKDLANSRHIVAPGYGHIVSFHACGPRLLATFVDEAGPAKLAPACIAHFEKSVPPYLFANRLASQP